MNQQDYQVAKRSLTFIIFRGQQEFQIHHDLKQWYKATPNLHLGFKYYSMTQKEQNEKNALQLIEVLKLVRIKGGLHQLEKAIPHLGDFVVPQVQRIFQIQMLNLRILKLLPSLQGLTTLLKQVTICSTFISLLTEEQQLVGTIKTDGLTTRLQEGKLYSQEGTYKLGSHYQGSTTQMALVTCLKENKTHLALVKIREQSRLCTGIEEKWQGMSIQNQQNYVVSFNGAQIEQSFELSESELLSLELWKTFTNYEDCQICLKELLRLCDITYRYCLMRKQFSTTDSGSERQILTYQVTTERIMNALAFGTTYYIGVVEAMKMFRADAIGIKERSKLNKSFGDCYSAYAMESCIKYAELLRECMGGFGFLYFSGAPQVQTKLIWIQKQSCQNVERKQQEYVKNIQNYEKNKFFILNYLGQMAVQNPQKMFEELGDFNKINVANPFYIYGYHAAKITERLQQTELADHCYTAYQMVQLTFELYVAQKFFNLIAFRRYRISNFILDRLLSHQNFQALKVMETNLEKLTLIKHQGTKNMIELQEQLAILMDCFEFEHNDILLGRSDEKEFYEKLLNLSKNENLRNMASTVNEIRKPILDLVNRPTL